VCRLKHVEQLRNIGIINSTTQSHLVPSFYEIPSDTSPKEIAASRLLNKISPVWEIYSFSKMQLFLNEELNNIEEKRKNQRGNKVTEQRNRKCKQPQYVRSTRLENAEKKSLKTDIPIQETSENSERNAVSAGINYVQTTKEGD
jgi:hypothetical protein